MSVVLDVNISLCLSNEEANWPTLEVCIHICLSNRVPYVEGQLVKP